MTMNAVGTLEVVSPEAVGDTLVTAPSRISINALCRREKVHAATGWRWVTKGVRNIVLKSHMVGGKRFTTDQDFQEFVRAVSEAPKPKETASARRSAIDRALEKDGF